MTDNAARLGRQVDDEAVGVLCLGEYDELAVVAGWPDDFESLVLKALQLIAVGGRAFDDFPGPLRTYPRTGQQAGRLLYYAGCRIMGISGSAYPPAEL